MFLNIYPNHLPIFILERWWKMNSIDSDANAWPTNMFLEKNHERFLGIPPKRNLPPMVVSFFYSRDHKGHHLPKSHDFSVILQWQWASTKQEWLIAKFDCREKIPASLTKPDQTAVCSGIHVVVGYLRSNLPMFSLASFLRSTSPTPSKKNVEMCSNSEAQSTTSIDRL